MAFKTHARTHAQTHTHSYRHPGAHIFYARTTGERGDDGRNTAVAVVPSVKRCLCRSFLKFSSSMFLLDLSGSRTNACAPVRVCVCACVRTSIWLLFRFSMSLRTSLSLSLSPRVHVCFVCVHLLFFPSLPRMCERPRMFSAWGRRGGGGGE